MFIFSVLVLAYLAALNLVLSIQNIMQPELDVPALIFNLILFLIFSAIGLFVITVDNSYD